MGWLSNLGRASVLALSGALLILQSVNADERARSIIAVIDNSGLVSYQYERNERGLSPYGITARLFISKFAPKLGVDVHLTLISVSRSEIIWQGPARKVDDNRNHIVADFITTEPGGCADFEAVLKTVRRATRDLEAPLSELLFLTPLVHTGPYPCELDRDNLAPPASFFEGLAGFQAESNSKLSFYWTHEGVLDEMDAHLFEKGVSFRTYNERQTMAQFQ